MKQVHFYEDLNEQTVHPSGQQQSITVLLKSLSSSTSSAEPSPSSPNGTLLQDLALRSRNRVQGNRRVFTDISDGFALLLMILQLLSWLALTLTVSFLCEPNWDHVIGTLGSLVKVGPLFLLISICFAFLSSIFVYFFTKIAVHLISLAVLAFTFYNVTFNLPTKFTSGNFASLLTFLFLALYYARGWKHLPLTCKFIRSASRLCWRNHVSLLFVFSLYALLIFTYLLAWSTSILIIQTSASFSHKSLKFASLIYLILSLMLSSAFLRDLLQIWLSRIIYTSTFAYTARPVIVTSLKRKPSIPDITFDNPINDTTPSLESNDTTASYVETKRIVTRESMWWTLGTAARSSFHLVLRGFQIHIWFLALLQVFFPNFGPPANPQCVLDIFHVPTAIYGTSYTKSRKFVADTMVDHGMDQISVDLYLRTFIYYMISYACGVLSLVTIWMILGDDYKFKISFLLDCTWSLLTTSTPIHFACIFVIFGVILFFTAIDSVHMILCWSICESPTSVSALEPDLMHLLVTTYHARLDLRRFSGDRIRTSIAVVNNDPC